MHMHDRNDLGELFPRDRGQSGSPMGRDTVTDVPTQTLECANRSCTAMNPPPFNRITPHLTHCATRGGGHIRWDVVDRVRQEIADGTYDTAERWEAALDRLCQHIAE